MWFQIKDFWYSWMGKISMAAAVLGFAGFLYYNKGKPQGQPQFRCVQIEVLQKKTLLRLFASIRLRYSKGYIALRAASRRRRRSYPPASPEYQKSITDFHKKAQNLLKEKSTEVLSELHIDEDLVDESCSFYINDKEIETARDLVNECFNNAYKTHRLKPEKLTFALTKEIFEYYQTHLVPENEDGMDEYLLSVAQIEDEIKEIYGFEMEEIEKAYEAYEADLAALTQPLKDQTRLMILQTAEDSSEETEATEQESRLQ